MIKKKIADRTAHAGVIGLGYVGLPLALTIAKSGFSVTGIDVNQRKVENIQQGISDVADVPSEDLGTFVQRGQIQATADYHILSELDTVNICVPTPLRKSKDPDMSFIISAVDAIAQYLRQDQLIILESTTYPGTTEEIVLPKLEERARDKKFFWRSPPRKAKKSTSNMTRTSPSTPPPLSNGTVSTSIPPKLSCRKRQHAAKGKPCRRWATITPIKSRPTISKKIVTIPTFLSFYQKELFST